MKNNGCLIHNGLRTRDMQGGQWTRGHLINAHHTILERRPIDMETYLINTTWTYERGGGGGGGGGGVGFHKPLMNGPVPSVCVERKL